MVCIEIVYKLHYKSKPKTMINEIKNTVTCKMVIEEARELSCKLKNTIYVIQKNNTLYTLLSNDRNVLEEIKGKFKILGSYKLGNKIS